MDRLAAWIGGVLLVTALLAIGLPLVGTRVFLATDNLYLHAPWSEQAPADLRPTNPLVADTVDAVTPRRAEFARRLRQGDLPLWTPLPGGGLPLAAQTNGGLLSPLNAAWALVPAWYAPALTKVVELVVAAGFTLLFLRQLGLGRGAALLGGFLYAFSAFQVVWTNWPQATVGATIPVLFWAVEGAVRARSAGRFAVVAVVVAVLLLGGFPSVAAFALLAAGAYAVVRTLTGEPGRRWGRSLRLLAGLAGAVALGLALAAFQVLPFLSRLGRLELGYRRQSGALHLPEESLITTVVPDAFGSPVDRAGMAGVVGAPLNYIEYQSFIGVVALVLLVAAAVGWRARTTPRGVRPFLWALLGTSVVLIYLGGPLLEALQAFPPTRPVFGINNVGRLRSVMGLAVAALAAGGFQALLDGTVRPRRRPLATVGAATVLLAGGGYLVLRLADLARRADLSGYVWQQSLLPLGIAAASLAALAVPRRPGRRPPAAWILPALFAVEVLALTLPFWPRVPRSEFYPVTAAHRFLEDNLGPDRLAAEDRTLYPGTTSFYGLRSVTAHAFLPPAWKDLIRAVEPDAFRRGATSPPVRGPTFPHLTADPSVASSPVLDRLAARYFATAPHQVFGARHPDPDPPAGQLTLTGGESVEVPVPRTDLRGAAPHLAAPFSASSGPARLRVTLLDATGRPVASGRRRLFPADPPVALSTGGDPFSAGGGSPFDGERPGPFAVALPEPPSGPAARSGTPGRLRITLEAPDGGVRLTTGGGGRPLVDLITATDDGLRVAFADGVVLYERARALPRIRWAGRAEVVEDPRARILRLTRGVDPDTVLLGSAGPTGSGASAGLEVVEDSGDGLVVEVRAAGAGYLVVADSLVDSGWTATLDGDPAELVAADHALAAVHVPAGRHRVDLAYSPASWRLGLGVSGAALAVLVLLVVTGLVRRARRGGAARAEAHPPVTTAPGRPR